MKNAALLLICAVVLAITLSLGLWPFHSPKNDVSWLGKRDGLRFGRYSTAFSSGSFQGKSPIGSGYTFEVWLQPRLIWGTGTIVAFYSQNSPDQFSLHQSQPDFLLLTTIPGEQSHTKTSQLSVTGIFHRPQPLFITVTTGDQGTAVYVDGKLVKRAADFRIGNDFMDNLVVGDSPGQSDSWSGQLMGLATYHSALTDSEVFRHYLTWTHHGHPEVTLEEGNIALYLFDEHTGNIAHDKAGSGITLYIPEKYTVIHQLFLEPLWSEFSMSRSYWSAVVKNIVGFIPFGFCFYALAGTRSTKRATLTTVALGTAVSLTIEILQVYLPTRDSGTTDLITNTLGTWLGVVSYDLLAPPLVRLFPWLPFPAPPIQ